MLGLIPPRKCQCGVMLTKCGCSFGWYLCRALARAAETSVLCWDCSGGQSELCGGTLELCGKISSSFFKNNFFIYHFLYIVG